ncbi:imidazoleglycerol-phosphate dehydratase HisB [Clostridium botulinum]|uniref:imidazoleglycerol-phosphate dehydratase HisB n=1 Tax=Clostridium botulinum TaxID=1491 RepID=UPI000773DB55|nr:imidazoleglycerol-phosphate dehydratase HisB [Clostridium botulinum]NFE94125.1 imidazoleglycerol-phosphate dehydratase HisB [Clostridium botulinum]NFL37359.1 imidazoleglycerol-phosphate dehydratase HisB [Clostridium botulinum]NFL63885.1 imidazoleglycerol-phosphate dehydratase HisB [Clostridium botulinum]NFN07076.1 imidazoleglycerol-phosphate dehydratase HisB [Clostridium botulinum]NFN23694.1 imidazoleglycerol-phosphate dehydratase HisB [Clostridium botulinum]
MQNRIAKIERNTSETKVKIDINLDGAGLNKIHTGIGFLDHMLELFSFHSNTDVYLSCDGDLNVCDHHSVEDVGIIFGKAFKEALGDKKGINRYGTFFLPMDEVLSLISLDISGRGFLVFDCEFTREKVGELSTEMIEEFFRAFALNSEITLHCKVLYGKNDHHKIESLFKGFGRALRDAKERNELNKVPSTKGIL